MWQGWYGNEDHDDDSPEVDLSQVVKSFEQRWKGRVFGNLREVATTLGFQPYGLEAVLQRNRQGSYAFLAETLPFIISQAGRLREHFPNLQLKKLVRNQPGRCFLERIAVTSLLANMFLCTFPERYLRRSMPRVNFDRLLAARARQEVAKLEMFIHYFERLLQEGPPPGQLRIFRQVRETLPAEEQEFRWANSSKGLLPVHVVRKHVGFEDVKEGEGCLHADFANMFIGGGVLSGGCVQEEIRFAICPELCASLVVCPVMLDNEAITVVGGEQFSRYEGYGSRLLFGGDFRNSELRRDRDGTPLVAITAMDALDFRMCDSSLRTQMSQELRLRELEKAAAAFAPVDKEALETWPVIATGNWGCGVFLGCAELKAILQWLAASEGGRQLKYFPFELDLGHDLSKLSTLLCEEGVTVGQAYQALRSLDVSKLRGHHDLLFRTVYRQIQEARNQLQAVPVPRGVDAMSSVPGQAGLGHLPNTSQRSNSWKHIAKSFVRLPPSKLVPSALATCAVRASRALRSCLPGLIQLPSGPGKAGASRGLPSAATPRSSLSREDALCPAAE